MENNNETNMEKANDYSWIDNEIKIACKKENPNWDGKSWDYGCSCYQNAGEAAKAALKVMQEAGHSGFSWHITTNILKRLLEEKPLTSLREEDFYKVYSYKSFDGALVYNNSRYLSLYKLVYPDGKVVYKDTNRTICFDVNNPSNSWGGAMSDIVDELFPIELPYFPRDKKYRVAVEEALHDKALGDFDMYCIRYIMTPDEDRVEVNKYYKEEIDHWVKYVYSDGTSHIHASSKGWREITEEEYNSLKNSPQIESTYKDGDVLEVVEICDSKCSCDCCG